MLGIPYTFSTTITAADPGPGIVRYNNATIASVTAIYIDNVDVDAVSETAWLDSFDDRATSLPSSPVRGSVEFKSADGVTIVNKFNITGVVVDSTGYRTLTVVYVSGALPSNAAALYATFDPAGFAITQVPRPLKDETLGQIDTWYASAIAVPPTKVFTTTAGTTVKARHIKAEYRRRHSYGG